MKAGRGLAVLFCAGLILLPGSGLAMAQEQEKQPETNESTDAAQDKAAQEKAAAEKAAAEKAAAEKAAAEKAAAEKAAAEMAAAEMAAADKVREAVSKGLVEKVTVTATRVETDLMKTPVAVTVIDQETLERQGVENITDIAQMVPNMDIATENGQSTPIISLRGIRSTNTTELGDPSVGVHLDGVYSPRMQGILAMMFDNERVEVLRGPQGTLFGRNSTVGSINIVTAKPKLDRFESRMNLQYGNYNAPELQLMVNKPLTDTFAVRFAGRFHRRDSYLDGYWDPNQYDQRWIADLVAGAEEIAAGIEDCTSPECIARTQTPGSAWWADDLDIPIRALVPADDSNFYMSAEEWAYRLSGLWQPKNKDVSLNFAFQHFRTDGAGGVDLVNCDKLRGRPAYQLDPVTQEPVLDAGGNPIVTGLQDCSTMFPKDDTYTAVVNVPGQLYLDIQYVRSRLNWDIRDNLRFVHLLGLEDQDRESVLDMEQSLNAWDQQFVFLPGTGSRSWVNEFQLQSFGNPHFNWIVGANYFYEKTSTFGFFDNAIDEKSLFDQPDRSTNAGSIFAQGTYSYNDRWHLTIGSRFSDETKEDVGGRTLLCRVDNGCNVLGVSVVNGTGTPEITLGFTRDELNALPVDFFNDPSVYAVSSINDNKDSWSHTDWRVGLDYQKDDDTLVYGYLATGFKGGGIGDVITGDVVTGAVDANGEPLYRANFLGVLLPYEDSRVPVEIRTAFDQEEVTTLEFGFKKSFLNRRLDLRGAYFYSDYKDLQYASPGSLGSTQEYVEFRDANMMPFDANMDGINDGGWINTPLFIGFFTRNIPSARIQGYELEYDARVWPGGRIHGYASWLDGEIDEDYWLKWDYDAVSYFGLNFRDAADTTRENLQVNLKGNDLAVSPPFKIHMTVDHAFLLEKKSMSIVPWVTAHWEDDSYLTVWNVDKHTDDLDFVIRDEDIRYTDDKREAWSMFHAGVSMYRGDWKAEIYGYNLTNEVVQWWGAAAEQVAKGSFSTPRTYGVRFGTSF